MTLARVRRHKTDTEFGLDGIDSSVPIVVLRRTFAPLQHGVLSVARSAGRLGIPVYAVRMSRAEPATSSRYISGALPLSDDAGDEPLLEALLRFGEQRRSAMLLPIDDESAVFVSDHRDRLARHFLMPETTPGLHRLLGSKRDLLALCKRIGIPAPASQIPGSADEAADSAEALGYPVVLKRSDGWVMPNDPSAPSVRIVRSRSELIHWYRRMDSAAGRQVLVQEYIPGGSDAVWMFNGYFGRDSRCLCAFTGQKLRQRGPHTGPTTLGVCVWNESVAAATKLLAEEVGYQGIIDVGFRYDARDGQYKLLDVNPRMGSTFRLFAGENDLDVVRAAYLDLTGQPVPPTRAVDGRRWIVEPYDLLSSAQIGREGALSVGAWLRSMRRVEEGAWWAPDDPVPFLAMVASLGRLGVGYVAARRQATNGDAAESHPEMSTKPSGSTIGDGVVERFFDLGADHWLEIYDDEGLQGVVYRQRMDTVLRWIQACEPATDATALDVGCGAGLLAARLAHAGLDVTAVDSSSEMVKRAHGVAASSGLEDRMHVVRADATRLPFDDGAFAFVVALGLLPWVEDPRAVAAEMARVLRPGGWLMVSADNRLRLNLLVEPRENPLLIGPKMALRAVRRLRGQTAAGPRPRLHLPRQVDRFLVDAGLDVGRRTTVGFGPFSVLGRPALNDERGIRLHSWLTRSTRRRRLVRRLGWHYIVAARKRTGRDGAPT